MDLHHLRILKFGRSRSKSNEITDDKCRDSKVNKIFKICNSFCGAEKHERPKVTRSAKIDRYIDSASTSKKRVAFENKPRNVFKSISKGSSIKKYMKRKMFSLNNLKQTLSLKSQDRSKGFEPKVLSVNRAMTSSHIEMKRKRSRVKNGEKNKEVKILFRNETMKFPKSFKKNLSKHSDSSRLFKESSSNVVGFYKSNNNTSSISYKQCRHIDSDRLKRFKEIRRKRKNVGYGVYCCDVRHTRRAKSTEKCASKQKMHHNLISFPQMGRNFTSNKSKNSLNIYTIKTTYSDCHCLDKQTSAYRSNLVDWKHGIGDTGVNTSGPQINESVKFTKILHSGTKARNVGTKTERNNSPKRDCSPCMMKRKISTFLESCPESRIRILKHILMGLSLIVWCPCMIAIAFCWFLTYPLRPRRKNHEVKFKKIKKSKCTPCRSRRSINWSEQCEKIRSLTQTHSIGNPLVKAISRLVKTILSFYHIDLSKSVQHNESITPKSSQGHLRPQFPYSRSQTHPNPKKSYTLYYKNRRGWLMKPNKQNRSYKGRGRVEIVQRANCRTCCPTSVCSIYKCLSLDDVCHESKRENKESRGTFLRNKHENISVEHKKPYLKTSQNEPEISDIRSKNWSLKTGTFEKNNQDIFNNPEKSSLKKSIYSQNKEAVPSIKPDQSSFKNSMSLQNREAVPSIKPDKSLKTSTPKHDPRTVGKSKSLPQNYNKSGSIPYYAPRQQTSPRPLAHNRVHQHRMHQSPVAHRHMHLYDPRHIGLLRYKSCKKKRPSIWKRFCRSCKRTKCRLGDIIDDVEAQIWDSKKCRDAQVRSMGKKQCFFIYKMCPSMYPCLMAWISFHKNLCKLFCCCLAACVWSPLIFCCYYCFDIFCRVF